MKQKLLKRKSKDWEVRSQGFPEYVIEEILIISKSDIESGIDPQQYAETHNYWKPKHQISKDFESEYKLRKFHKVPPTVENKAKIRNEYNSKNTAYTCCVACGKELHDHNRDSHFESEFGIIGPECYKKYLPILAATA